MFGCWLIVLSGANQMLWLCKNQEIAKEKKADDQVVPVIMVKKLDVTIDCIDNIFKAGDPAKH